MSRFVEQIEVREREGAALNFPAWTVPLWDGIHYWAAGLGRDLMKKHIAALAKRGPIPSQIDAVDFIETTVTRAIERQREADAALVEAAGCLCWPLDRAGVFEGEFEGSKIRTRPGGSVEDLRFVATHDPRCPCALAAKIRGQA
jgi:hypothetical protein